MGPERGGGRHLRSAVQDGVYARSPPFGSPAVSLQRSVGFAPPPRGGFALIGRPHHMPSSRAWHMPCGHFSGRAQRTSEKPLRAKFREHSADCEVRPKRSSENYSTKHSGGWGKAPVLWAHRTTGVRRANFHIIRIGITHPCGVARVARLDRGREKAGTEQEGGDKSGPGLNKRLTD